MSVDSDEEESADDHTYDVGIPGLPNLHSHAFQRALSGLTETRGMSTDSFWSWREQMYRFLDRMTPDDVEAVSEFAYMEMLESGFTHVGEFHYLHHDPDGVAYEDAAEMATRICAAAVRTGIGLTLIPVFYAYSNFGGKPPEHGQRRFVTSLDQFSVLLTRCREEVAKLPGAQLAVAPHSLRAATPEALDVVVSMLPDAPVHIHAAEQVREVEESVAVLGQRPVEWLLDHASVDSRWCLIHATHMTPSETIRLAASGAVAGLCPITEANLGDGIFPGLRYAESGGRFGVGSDSNVHVSATHELRQLEYGQRLAEQARNVLAETAGSNGAFLWDHAVRGGSQALGITPGGSADFVTLDVNHPNLVGKSNDALLDSMIFGGVSVIQDVWRGGKRVVEQGRHIHHQSIAARYRQVMRQLLS